MRHITERARLPARDVVEERRQLSQVVAEQAANPLASEAGLARVGYCLLGHDVEEVQRPRDGRHEHAGLWHRVGARPGRVAVQHGRDGC